MKFPYERGPLSPEGKQHSYHQGQGAETKQILYEQTMLKYFLPSLVSHIF